MLQEVLQKNSKARGAARARRLARGRLPHQQAAGLQAHPAEPVDALLVEQGEGPDRAADADARTRRGTTAIRVPAAACAASAGGLESEREAGLSPLQAGRAWRPHEEAEEGWEPSSRGAAPAPSSSGGSSEDYGFSNNTRSSMGPPALSAERRSLSRLVIGMLLDFAAAASPSPVGESPFRPAHRRREADVHLRAGKARLGRQRRERRRGHPDRAVLSAARVGLVIAWGGLPPSW